MDKTLITALIAMAVVVAAFFGGYFLRKCPTTDPSVVEALMAKTQEQEREIEALRTLADTHRAIADSIRNSPKPNVDKVLPTIPAGRSDAGLDSLRAILLRQP